MIFTYYPNDFCLKIKIYNFDPYNVFLIIATNALMLLMTVFFCTGSQMNFKKKIEMHFNRGIKEQKRNCITITSCLSVWYRKIKKYLDLFVFYHQTDVFFLHCFLHLTDVPSWEHGEFDPLKHRNRLYMHELLSMCTCLEIWVKKICLHQDYLTLIKSYLSIFTQFLEYSWWKE